MRSLASQGPPVLLVTGDFVRTGGMDAANFGLARYLARFEVPLHLVAHRVAPELAVSPGVRVHRVLRPAGSSFLGGPLLNAAGRRVARKVMEAGGRVVVNGGNCDVEDVSWVHYVHAAFRAAPDGGALRRAKARLAGWTYRRQERERIGRARVVVANSERTRADLIEWMGLRADRVKVVYYGIEPTRFRPGGPEEREAMRQELGVADGAPLVAFVGALGDRRKGFDVLFQAWSALAARGWEGTLAVVGRGAELERWRARADEAERDLRIRFLGFRDDVDRILRGSDALVSPARYEAYGLGVQEALCCGVPALVSARAGVSERYPRDMRSLLIADPESPEEVASALERWRADQAHWKARTTELSNELRHHTWDEMARRFLEAIAG